VRATERGKRASSLRINNEFEEFEEPKPGVPCSWAENRELYGQRAWSFDPLHLTYPIRVNSIDVPPQPSARAPQSARAPSNSRASFSSTEHPKAGLWEHCSEYGIWMSSDGALGD
jgi:hypothetical protein